MSQSVPFLGAEEEFEVIRTKLEVIIQHGKLTTDDDEFDIEASEDFETASHDMKSLSTTWHYFSLGALWQKEFHGFRASSALGGVDAIGDFVSRCAVAPPILVLDKTFRHHWGQGLVVLGDHFKLRPLYKLHTSDDRLKARFRRFLKKSHAGILRSLNLYLSSTNSPEISEETILSTWYIILLELLDNQEGGISETLSAESAWICLKYLAPVWSEAGPNGVVDVEDRQFFMMCARGLEIGLVTLILKSRPPPGAPYAVQLPCDPKEFEKHLGAIRNHATNLLLRGPTDTESRANQILVLNCIYNLTKDHTEFFVDIARKGAFAPIARVLFTSYIFDPLDRTNTVLAGILGQLCGTIQRCSTQELALAITEPLMGCDFLAALYVWSCCRENRVVGEDVLLKSAKDTAGAIFETYSLMPTSCRRFMTQLVGLRMHPQAVEMMLRQSVLQSNLDFWELVIGIAEAYISAATDTKRLLQSAKMSSVISPTLGPMLKRSLSSVAGEYSCAVCHAVSHASMSRCSICQQTSYCSKACQKADWKTHRSKCKPIAKTEE